MATFRAELLLEDYNKYRANTHNVQEIRKRQPLRDIGKAKGLPVMEALDNWCLENKLDSRRWLYYQFKRRNWQFAPPLNQLIPCGGKPKTKKQKQLTSQAIARFNLLSDTPLLSESIRQGWQKKKEEEGNGYDCNRDITYAAEILKERYLLEGRPDKCLDQMFEVTYGYHPKSKNCMRCPISNHCALVLRSKVVFDIVALRSGQMTLQQAQTIVGRMQHG